jgi:hypothetical protein
MKIAAVSRRLRSLGALARIEPGRLVRGVAERLRPRLPAAAQRDGPVTVDREAIPVGIDQFDGSGDLVRAVVADLDDDALVHAHIIGAGRRAAWIHGHQAGVPGRPSAESDGQAVTTTICTFCGVGCNLELHEQDNEIVKVTSPLDHPVTSGNLCIKGRFGFQFVQNDRTGLPAPLEEIPAGPGPGPPAPAEARDGHDGDGFRPRDSDPAG